MAHGEDALYEQVAAEIAAGKYAQGVLARALAESDGDKDKARAIYIRLRVQQLKAKAEEKAPQEAAQEEPAASARQGATPTDKVLAVLLGAFASPLLGVAQVYGAAGMKALLPWVLWAPIVVGMLGAAFAAAGGVLVRD